MSGKMANEPPQPYQRAYTEPYSGIVDDSEISENKRGNRNEKLICFCAVPLCLRSTLVTASA